MFYYLTTQITVPKVLLSTTEHSDNTQENSIMNRGTLSFAPSYNI